MIEVTQQRAGVKRLAWNSIPLGYLIRYYDEWRYWPSNGPASFSADMLQAIIETLQEQTCTTS